MTKNFIPYGHQEGMIEPTIIHRFDYEDRVFFVCEYGFMIGVFDMLTGGKIHAIDISQFPPKSNPEYIAIAVKRTADTLALNTKWRQTLDNLPKLD